MRNDNGEAGFFRLIYETFAEDMDNIFAEEMPRIAKIYLNEDIEFSVEPTEKDIKRLLKLLQRLYDAGYKLDVSLINQTIEVVKVN